ncbi:MULTISPECIES: hypothetical protein [unclassified Aureispira]|uniref:hypothetical protein n=1 Tax=unclassified Aureispira TaxID=2649989 RepID=UPI000695C010|nr:MULTISPECIES: hypothetical protein [unclassified Aureispira]WMX13784.1 hypothetical protein QP953_23315 [Aureispira sp. CCB-E]
MKVLNNLLTYGLLVVLSIMVVSCSSDQTETADANTTDVESTEINTRSASSKIAAKAFYYNSLATFKEGYADVDISTLATLEGKKVNLVVLYEADAPWAEIFNTGKYDQTGNDTFNGLMASYQLDIVQQFAIDEDNEGLVLEPNALLENPVEAARELSLVEDVLMVQIKEVPQEEDLNTTADVN